MTHDMKLMCAKTVLLFELDWVENVVSIATSKHAPIITVYYLALNCWHMIDCSCNFFDQHELISTDWQYYFGDSKSGDLTDDKCFARFERHWCVNFPNGAIENLTTELLFDIAIDGDRLYESGLSNSKTLCDDFSPNI